MPLTHSIDYFFRQAAQKRDGHGQAEAGQDPQTQQTQSSLRLILGSLAGRNEEKNEFVFVTRRFFRAVEIGRKKRMGKTAWRRPPHPKPIVTCEREKK